MKRSDIFFAVGIIALFLPFVLIAPVYETYKSFNAEHGLVTSFVKFAILATLGEMLGLRIKTGMYNKPGFGVWPRAMVWGFLGITIYAAFVIFATGVPNFIKYLGIEVNNANLYGKITLAFAISFFMNLIYAPVMMTLHKITDMHILANEGKLSKFFSSFPMGEYMKTLDWHTQWHFVFKKTIPFFWIPAHTITFLLPAGFRVLFAALLGIALGVLLSVAGKKSEKLADADK